MWPIDYPTTRLVARHRGTLPVILTCPHGGDALPPGVPTRTGQATPAGCDFAVSRDLHTRDVTVGVAQAMLDASGQAPYVVIAEFHRKMIDANRSRTCAFETPSARPFYDEYHATVRAFVDEIRAENGGLGLLFDIHGTAGIAADPADIYLGTVDGDSVRRLLDVDALALWRRASLRGFLEDAGHVVSPKAPGQPEAPGLSGGFTVRTYGSAHADGLDAMQLEIAPALRTDPVRRDAFIGHLAFAIANVATRYADVCVSSVVQQVVLPAGMLRRSRQSGDAGLTVGGLARHRGRVEIRHDPAAPPRPGVLVLSDANGDDSFLWVDAQGRLRISPTDPGHEGGAGVPVGRQT